MWGPLLGGRSPSGSTCAWGGMELKLFSDASSRWGGGESRGSTSLVPGGYLARSSDGLGSSAKRVGEVGPFSVALGEGQGGPESADFVACESSGLWAQVRGSSPALPSGGKAADCRRAHTAMCKNGQWRDPAHRPEFARPWSRAAVSKITHLAMLTSFSFIY